MDFSTIIKEFHAFARSHGYDIGTIETGKLIKFQLDQKDSKKSGFYILHADGVPNGMIGDWRTNQKFNWKGKPSEKLSPDELIKQQKIIERQKQIVEAEKKRNAEASAIEAMNIFKNGSQIDHAYLNKKQIEHFGTVVASDGALIVPARNITGKITSLQKIYPTGKKYFLENGEIQGSFHLIGDISSNDTFLICEGYATGASLHMASGLPVVVAFNTGNLEPVGIVLRKRYPEKRIVICADNDIFTEKPIPNPGVFYAENLATKIDAEVLFPEFEEETLDSKPTDFNDYQTIYGLEKLKALIDLYFDQGLMENETDHLGDLSDSHQHTAKPLIFQHVTPKNKPLATIQNVEALFEHYGIRVTYNMLKAENEIFIPGMEFLDDTQKVAKLAHIQSILSVHQFPAIGLSLDYLNAIGSKYPKNPILDFVTAEKWDGVDRFSQLCDTIKSPYDSTPELAELKKSLIRKWMLSAVALGTSTEPYSAHGVLVFQGKQNIGKTRWLKSLVPPSENLTLDGVTLDPSNKDSVLNCVSFWLVELGELDATFRKSDISALKAFITKTHDVIRKPYARESINIKRRTVFFASVNDEEFLSDTTGNRRYWIIPVDSLNYDHEINTRQLWSQIYEDFKKCDPYDWALNARELDLMNRENIRYEVKETMEELLETGLGWNEANPGYRWMTATDLCRMCDVKIPTKRDKDAVAKILRRRGVTSRVVHGYRFYQVPVRIDSEIYSNGFHSDLEGV